MRNPSCHRRSCRAPELGSGGAGRGGGSAGRPERTWGPSSLLWSPAGPSLAHPAREGLEGFLFRGPESLVPRPGGWAVLTPWRLSGRARSGDWVAKLAPGGPRSPRAHSTLTSPLPDALASRHTSLTPAWRTDSGDSTLGRAARRCWSRQGAWWRGSGRLLSSGGSCPQGGGTRRRGPAAPGHVSECPGVASSSPTCFAPPGILGSWPLPSL